MVNCQEFLHYYYSMTKLESKTYACSLKTIGAISLLCSLLNDYNRVSVTFQHRSLTDLLFLTEHIHYQHQIFLYLPPEKEIKKFYST